MQLYMCIVDKLTPVHERYIGQEIKVTNTMKKNDKGELKPDFRIPLYRCEVDNNLKLIQQELELLKRKFKCDIRLS